MSRVSRLSVEEEDPHPRKCYFREELKFSPLYYIVGGPLGETGKEDFSPQHFSINKIDLKDENQKIYLSKSVRLCLQSREAEEETRRA